MKRIIYLSLSICLGLTACSQKTDKEKVESIITQETIKKHIYFLADDNLKGRETGTPELKIAADYLAKQLEDYGVKPNPKTNTYFQDVPLQRTLPPNTLKLSINNTQVNNLVSLSASKVEVNANAVVLGYGLEDDYVGKNVDGKIVLIKSGNVENKGTRGAYRLRKKKEDIALTHGAIGIVEFLDANETSWDYVDHNFNAPKIKLIDSALNEDAKPLNYIWVKDTDYTMFSEISKQQAPNINLESSSNSIETITSQNVIGMVEGTDLKLKDEFIIYSAHYDHVGIGTPDDTGDTIYNGARDNAVGTTTVLSMAQHLAKYPTKRSALFILFTGEEKGLLGSKYYTENPVLPLQNMVFCFNSDNAGYNDTSIATIVGLPRTTAEQHIKNAAATFGITAVDDPAPEQGLFDRSDNVHFAKKGIPAPTFSLGFTAFNGDVTKYYHRPNDEANTLDYNYLESFFKAYVMSGVLIGNDLKTPTWTSGDVYEEAAQVLYSK